MLESEHVADRVTALVHAPENLADRFDQLGCLVPLHWRQPAVPPADHVVQVADRPDDQAAAVAAWLSRLPGPLRADDITLGIADESMVPVVARQMADCHVATRWVQEAALSETRPWRLLETVADCLSSVSVHDSGAKSTADQDGSDDDGSNDQTSYHFRLRATGGPVATSRFQRLAAGSTRPRSRSRLRHGPGQFPVRAPRGAVSSCHDNSTPPGTPPARCNSRCISSSVCSIHCSIWKTAPSGRCPSGPFP